jgi:hypothetical protein
VTQPYLSPEAAAYRDEQIAEYEQYRADGPIRSSTGALMYAKGHPIPASNVDAKGRVVTARHVCGDHDICEHFNEPIAWSDEGAVTLSDAGKRRQAAKKAAETRAASKDNADSEPKK